MHFWLNYVSLNFFSPLILNDHPVELWWAMIFKVIPHSILNKTHFITGSSNIISSENLAEKSDFLEFPLYITKFNPSGTLLNDRKYFVVLF